MPEQSFLPSGPVSLSISPKDNSFHPSVIYCSCRTQERVSARSVSFALLHLACPLHCSTKHVAGCPISRSVTLRWTFPHSSTVPCTHSVPRVPSSAHFFLNFVCCSCFLRFLLSQIKYATITLYLSKWLTPQAPPETTVLDSQKAPETDLFLRIFLFFFLPFFTHFPIGDVQTGLELLLCKIMLQSQCGTSFSLKLQIAGNTSETCGQEGRDKEALENKYA